MAALLMKRTSAECGVLPRTHAHNRHAHLWSQSQPIGMLKLNSRCSQYPLIIHFLKDFDKTSLDVGEIRAK